MLWSTVSSSLRISVLMLAKMYPSEDGLLAETCQGWIYYQWQITLDGFMNPYILDTWYLKLETSNNGLLHKPSKRFSLWLLKPNINFTQFLFSEHLVFWFNPLSCPVMTLWVWIIIFLFGTVTSSPHFHMDTVHEHLFQCLTLTCHVSKRGNVTDWTFNTVANTWDYGQQACNTQACVS
jgi:hypothetical protein